MSENLEADNNEVEVQENPLAGLVDAALAKDYNKANEIFGQAISVKLDDVLDQEKIRLSNAIYNGGDDDEEEVEDSDEIEDEDLEDSEDVSDDDMDVEDSNVEGDTEYDDEDIEYEEEDEEEVEN